MRRKVLQHFVNTPPQRLLDLPSGSDLARFVNLAAGTLEVDYLRGECRYNGLAISPMDLCAEHQAWIERESRRHHIPMDALVWVSMTVEFAVSGIKVERSFGHTFRSAWFSFDCISQIRTDEGIYASHQAGRKQWGYGYYWERLYGAEEANV